MSDVCKAEAPAASQGQGCRPEAGAVGPVRVQLSRKKGWRMPPNTVKVTRPGKYGNPFKVGCNPSEFSADLPQTCETVEEAVACFDYYAGVSLMISANWLDPLRGKNLACWCALNEPCHANVLLRLANPSREAATSAPKVGVMPSSAPGGEVQETSVQDKGDKL